MTAQARLELTREQILAYRQRVQALDARLPAGEASLRQAAWAGLQDSVPRAALLSIHARVAATRSDTWEDPSLVQLWGPRFSAYVVAAVDHPLFSLGRLTDRPVGQRLAYDLATRLETWLDGRAVDYAEAGRALGEPPNRLRHAAPTGRMLIRWDGAQRPTVRSVPAPDIDPAEARRELARRFLHVFGPTTPQAFITWAGIRSPRGHDAFAALGGSLLPVHTPIGDAWILSQDETMVRMPPGPAGPARLLPSGDAYFLLQDADRTILLPDARQRAALWTTRVWPGAILLGGEVVGTWRRNQTVVTLQPWGPLVPAERDAIGAEATTLPLPGVAGRLTVRWEG